MDESKILVGWNGGDIEEDQPKVDSVWRLARRQIMRKSTLRVSWASPKLTMPSESASTLHDSTRYFSSSRLSNPFPFCGPSRNSVSSCDLFIPMPEPVLRAGRLCVGAGAGAARVDARVAASLLDRARRCVWREAVLAGVPGDLFSLVSVFDA